MFCPLHVLQASKVRRDWAEVFPGKARLLSPDQAEAGGREAA